MVIHRYDPSIYGSEYYASVDSDPQSPPVKAMSDGAPATAGIRAGDPVDEWEKPKGPAQPDEPQSPGVVESVVDGAATVGGAVVEGTVEVAGAVVEGMWWGVVADTLVNVTVGVVGGVAEAAGGVVSGALDALGDVF